MKFLVQLTPLLIFSALAAGCSLEVEQHPPWVKGEYNGKQDDLPQRTYFHNDRLAWDATINNRNRFQNEYNRTRP